MSSTTMTGLRSPWTACEPRPLSLGPLSPSTGCGRTPRGGGPSRLDFECLGPSVLWGADRARLLWKLRWGGWVGVRPEGLGAAGGAGGGPDCRVTDWGVLRWPGGGACHVVRTDFSLSRWCLGSRLGEPAYLQRNMEILVGLNEYLDVTNI